MKHNILITGGTGFVGLSLIPLLLKDGHTVSVLCRDKIKAQGLLNSNVRIIIGDVTSVSSIEGCCDGIDIVYHMVAKVGNELPTKEAFDAFRKVNVEGTINMIEQAKLSKVKKFIYVSSIAAMGIVRKGIITENSPCDPYLPYQISKREAELAVLNAFKSYKFPAIIIRPAKVYGYGEREYSYLSLAKLCRKGFFPKVGFGKNMTCHLYISDLIEALYNTVDRGVYGEIYNLASKDAISFENSARIIAEQMNKKIRFIYIPTWMMISLAYLIEHLFLVLGKKPPITMRNVEATVTDRVYDIAKPMKELGFYPKVSMDEGIKRVIGYYKEKKLI